MKFRIVQIMITVSAILFAAVHLIWPALTIDSITIALVIIAIIPWLGSLFKAVELPGGLKIEYHELQKAANDAEKAGLLKKTQNTELSTKGEYSFQQIASDDPNLALAGLRIEIEKRLIEIANSYKIQIRKGGVASLSRTLKEQGILSSQEYSALLDIVVLLNSAVHGAKVGVDATNWALDVGSQLLDALDEKIVK
jgi:hypothetical protein